MARTFYLCVLAIKQEQTDRDDIMTTAVLRRRVRGLLKKSKLSESELARRTGIPRATLNRLVAGKMANPKMAMLKTLASYFDLSVDALFMPTPKTPKKTNSAASGSSAGCASASGSTSASASSNIIPPVSHHPAVTSLPWVAWDQTHALEDAMASAIHMDWMGMAPPEGAFLTTPTETRLDFFPNHKQLILVAPQAKPRPGQLVVLHMLEDGCNIVRQMFIAQKQFRFKNPNSQLHEALNSDQFTFVGTVHQVLQLD
jgi:DNA-binding XRE family transcriptional regulator